MSEEIELPAVPSDYNVIRIGRIPVSPLSSPPYPEVPTITMETRSPVVTTPEPPPDITTTFVSLRAPELPKSKTAELPAQSILRPSEPSSLVFSISVHTVNRILQYIESSRTAVPIIQISRVLNIDQDVVRTVVEWLRQKGVCSVSGTLVFPAHVVLAMASNVSSVLNSNPES